MEDNINNGDNKLSPEERKKKMKMYYDDEVDALYLKLGDETPEGVIEISEGVNLDTTSEDKIVGIEILNASQKMDLKTILSELHIQSRTPGWCWRLERSSLMWRSS
ncbi:MAG: DUF2283 domain-containing protein [Bacillota bacterium]